MAGTETETDQKRQRPWPNGAEWARADSLAAAADAATLLRSALQRTAQARAQLAHNPALADLLLADAAREQAEALALQSEIQRMLTDARYGQYRRDTT